MRQAMGYPETTEDTGRQFRQIMNILTQSPEKYQEGSLQLTVANSVWGQTRHPFLEGYTQSLENHYGAGLRETDFGRDPGGATGEINNWVAQETGDRIQDLFPEGSINSDTRLVLANAVHFRANWSYQFAPRNTEQDTFNNLDGSTVPVAMMHQSATMPYHQGDGFQAVIRFFDGYDTTSIIILPDQGRYREVEETLDDDILREIWEARSSWDVDLKMPRLEMNGNIELTKLMGQLGMTDLFSETKADLSGMNGENCRKSPGNCLHLDSALHRSFVRVDEKGTEAAAATGGGHAMSVSETPDYPDAEMWVDRPFIMIITHLETGVDLFTGRVTKMTPEMAGDLDTEPDPVAKRPFTPSPTMRPTPVPEGYCDRLLKNQLLFQRGASTAEGMNEVIGQLQYIITECDEEQWNPQVDDSTAAEQCWNGDMEAPIGAAPLTHQGTDSHQRTGLRQQYHHLLVKE